MKVFSAPIGELHMTGKVLSIFTLIPAESLEKLGIYTDSGMQGISLNQFIQKAVEQEVLRESL